MNTIIYQSLAVAGLSVVLFAMVGATVLFLLEVVFEVRQYDGPGSQVIVLGTAFVLLLVVVARFQGQLLQDAAIVLLNQPVQTDAPGICPGK